MKRKTGEYLLKEGKISAGEFYSIITKDPVSLYGVDDPGLYQENLAAFKDLIDKKLVIRKELKGLKRAVAELESKVYSPKLLELTHRKLLHKNGDIKFTEYWDGFSRLAGENGVDYAKYPNLKKLASTVDLEKEIDFKKAGTERDALIEELGAKLSKLELEKLVLQALQYKQNKITPGTFHYFLSQVSQGARINPLQYKNVILYSEYVVLYENVDLITIFDEVENFENELKAKLFTNDDERSLADLTHCVNILSQLLDTALTSKDYEFYVANERACEIESLEAVFQSLGEKYKVPYETYTDFQVLQSAIPSAKRFYELATKRNEVLLKNTIERMKKENVHVAALITGGFHSEGISKLMDEERLSYLVVMPKFDDKSPDRPYIAILTQKPKEYEEAFRDSDFYLATQAYFTRGNLGDSPERVNGILATVAVAARLAGVGLGPELISQYVNNYSQHPGGFITAQELGSRLASLKLRKTGDAFQGNLRDILFPGAG